MPERQTKGPTKALQIGLLLGTADDYAGGMTVDFGLFEELNATPTAAMTAANESFGIRLDRAFKHSGLIEGIENVCHFFNGRAEYHNAPTGLTFYALPGGPGEMGYDVGIRKGAVTLFAAQASLINPDEPGAALSNHFADFYDVNLNALLAEKDSIGRIIHWAEMAGGLRQRRRAARLTY